MKIYVIGINFENPDYEEIFQALDDGAEIGIEYKLLPWMNIKKEKELDDAEAFIFLEMIPVERIYKNKPIMFVSHHDDKNTIITKLNQFALSLQDIKSSLHENECIQKEISLNNTLSEELIPEEILASRLKEITIKIKNKDITLNPGDLALLVKIDKFIKDNNYTIEEIVM